MFRGLISRSEAGLVAPKSRSALHTPVGVSVGHWEGPTLWHGVDPLDLATHARCAGIVRGIQRFHMSGIYVDVAYHHLGCPHGYLFEGRGLGIAGGANGTNDSNLHRYSVCSIVGVDDPTTKDNVSAVVFALELYHAHGAASTADGHRDVVATQCPGDELNYVVNLWRASGVPLPPPAPLPHPTPIPLPATSPPWPGRFLKLTFPALMHGTDVRRWQERMKARGWRIGVDGIYGNESDRVCRGFQADKGLTVDGVVGPATWRAAWATRVT